HMRALHDLREARLDIVAVDYGVLPQHMHRSATAQGIIRILDRTQCCCLLYKPIQYVVALEADATRRIAGVHEAVTSIVDQGCHRPISIASLYAAIQCIIGESIDLSFAVGGV